MTKVRFDRDGRWLFTDAGGYAPRFDQNLDTRILDEAADEAYREIDLPAAFVYDPDTRTVVDLRSYRCPHPIAKEGPAQCKEGHWYGSPEHPVLG